MTQSRQNNMNGASSKGSRYIRLQVNKGHSDIEENKGELEEILGNTDNKSLNKFKKNLSKILRGRKIIKKVILPLNGLSEFIDELSYVRKEVSELYRRIKEKDDTKIGEIKKMLNPILISRKSEINIQELSEMLEKMTKEGLANFHNIFAIIKNIYSNEKNGMIQELLNILDRESENISLKGSMSTGEHEEIPSFDVFMETIKMEIDEYLKRLNFLGLEGDNDVINSILIGQWLKDQKDKSYIKLPFFDEMIKKIEGSRRNGKVGQVVLKGPPGTGKTRIFEFLGEKLRRPIKVISMHEYINFYELLIQTTNLSPTKNQIEFIDTIIKNYKENGGEEILRELGVLFEKNKDKFPAEYNLVDFINNIFDSSKYTGIETKTKKLEKITDPEEVKKYVINALKYWKNEKIFKLLLNKKEIIEGELLNCISNGEIPLLDEIDKVKEKEVNGILSFLDLETGQYHKIQGTDREVYIPEWFGVYATSNDDLKPSGPLGRRFNSVHFDFLDIENMTMYLVSRIVDNELSCPFDNNELKQIAKCLNIIAEAIESNTEEGTYSYLDFSIRLLDNFINSFIKIKNGIVQKRFEVWNKNEYIYLALQKAFEMQTEDVYGNMSNKQISTKTLGEQKSQILEIIDNEIKNEKNEGISRGIRLSKGIKARVNAVLRKIDLDNILLRLILTDQKTKYIEGTDKKTRILNYSEQISEILIRSNSNLETILRQEKKEMLKEGNVKSIDFKGNNHDILLDADETKNILKITIDKEKNITYGCESIIELKENRYFLVNQGEELGGYIIIQISDDEDNPVEIVELTKNIEKNGIILKGIMNFNGKLLFHKSMGEGSKNSIISLSDTKEANKTINGAEKKYSGITKIIQDDGGYFGFIYYENGKSLEIISIIDNKNKDRVYGGLSYNNKLGIFSSILNISIEDFGLSEEEGWTVEGAKFDSTFEYIFIELKNSAGEIIYNTVKL